MSKRICRFCGRWERHQDGRMIEHGERPLLYVSKDHIRITVPTRAEASACGEALKRAHHLSMGLWGRLCYLGDWKNARCEDTGREHEWHRDDDRPILLFISPDLATDALITATDKAEQAGVENKQAESEEKAE